jgi:hypothetical protein
VCGDGFGDQSKAETGAGLSAAARGGEPLENAPAMLDRHAGSGIVDDHHRRRALSLHGDPDQTLAVLISAAPCS